MSLAGVLLAVVLGCALQLQQAGLAPASVYGLWVLAGLVLGLLAWGLRRWGAPLGRAGPGRVLPALLLSAGVACLAFASTGLRALHFAQQALPPALEGQDIQVEGRIVDMPQRGEFGPRFVLQVTQADVAGVPPRLLISWYHGPVAPDEGTAPARTSPVLRAGEQWRFVVRLKAPQGLRNPRGFDYELWLWERGIQATGSVRARVLQPQRLAPAPALSLQGARQSVRDAVFARVGDAAPAGVLAGLAVGDQQAITHADWDVFRATGVAHLMSISGLHVTMFAWLAAALVGAAWRRCAPLCLMWPAPHAALLGGTALAALYAAFSGGGIPAQRTVWMLATVGLLRLAGLRWPWPYVWGGVAAAMALIDPWALLQPGFWLSFVAVGILFATDDGPTHVRSGGLGARCRALLREQGVITVALAPLTLALFGQVSLVGLVANLVAIPWVTLVVTPLALAGTLWPPLWDAGAWAVGALMQVLQVLALLPGGVWSAAAAPVWAAWAGLAGGLLLVMRLPPPLRALGLPLMWPLLAWQAPRPPAGQFELLAADIGQGTAVIVRTATRSLLYDTGPRFGSDSDAGQRVLLPLLRAFGDRPERVVVSHRDNDHIGGAASVLAQHEDAALLSSIEHGHPLAVLHRHTRCLAGQHWTWDGVDFEFLHPRAVDYAVRSDKPNTVSCVLRITAAADARGKGACALLTGDIERAQELALVSAQGDRLRCELLLVPHHGSKTSSSEVFLDAVQPRVALVQAGYRNRYGHPAEPVMARYAQRGIPVWTSPACGAAGWSSSAPDQVRCERELARRYWHHATP